VETDIIGGVKETECKRPGMNLNDVFATAWSLVGMDADHRMESKSEMGKSNDEDQVTSGRIVSDRRLPPLFRPTVQCD
jgi:hypothetical protein